MSWFACHRTKAADELQRKHPNAMLLFLIVARRARYEDDPCPITGLEKGECLIGDHESAGLTRQEYRTALGVLEKLDFLTTKRTNKGTTCKISERPLSSTVFTSFNHSLQPADQPADQPIANQQPTTKKKDIRKEEEQTLPFGSPEFASVWEDWKTFRIQKKSKLTTLSITRQFKQFSEWGERASIQSIEQSISQGWTGLFAPKRDKSKLEQTDFKASNVGI